LVFSGLPGFLNAQETILSIKENNSGIAGKMQTSIYQQERKQFEKLIATLNLDVLDYYEIKNQYKTDIKIQAYKESDDYNSKLSQLQNRKSDLLTETWYLDFEPDYFDEKSISVRYNPDTKSFPVSNNVSFSIFYDKPGYIQFDQLLFKCPAGMTIDKRNVNYACADVVEQTISFEISNDFPKSKIEENKNDLRLLFVFNFTGATSAPGKKSNLMSTDYYLMTDLHKVIVYNSKTNEVYLTYK
jgi:hypothetical protein